MATIGSTALTWIDWAKRLDPDGKVPTIIELLSQTNEVLQDMMVVEGNLPTGHQTTVRTGLPSVTWRLLNYGVASSKSQTAQVTDSTGMLEAFSQVDVDLASLNGNTAEFRLSEARAFLEAMNQEMASTIFYGNTTLNPERFMGLSPRYNALTGAGNSENIINANGSGSDNTSIWLIVWGDQTCHGIFPKGSKAGLIHEDLGVETVYDTSVTPPTQFRAWRDRYQWKNGLTLRDWRYVVRIANIDVSNLVALSSNADLITLMIRALDKIPSMGMGRPVFYMNRTVHTMLRILAKSASANVGFVEQATNQFQSSFFGVPIRKVDALLNTESAVA